MSIITSIPYPDFIDNVTVASGASVNANNASIISQVNANAAANGVNDDITELEALASPPAGTAALVFTAAEAGGTVNALVVATTFPVGYTLRAGNRVTFFASGPNTGAMTLNVNGTGVTPLLKIVNGAVEAFVGGEIAMFQAIDVWYDGTNYQALNVPYVPASAAGEPTYQVFTSPGSGTYTTPAGCERIEVEMVAGGGGAGSAGTGTSGSVGTVGTASSFNSITTAPGNYGSPNNGLTGGVGGAASGNGSGTAIDRTQGPGGDAGCTDLTGGVLGSKGSPGAGSRLGGGAPAPAFATNGITAVVPGAGGSAPSGVPGSAFGGAGAGGAGEYAMFVINAPTASYSYTVGAAGVGGSAGSSGNAGGNGGPGWIKVKEFYS